MTINQDLYNRMYDIAVATGVTTHLTLPMNEVPYPFIVMGEIQIVPRKTATRLLGKAYVTMQVLGSRTQRKEVSATCEKLRVNSRLIKTKTRTLKQVVNASDYQIREDNSTANTLWQGVLNIEFNIL